MTPNQRIMYQQCFFFDSFLSVVRSCVPGYHAITIRLFIWLNHAEWRIYASVNQDIICSDNDLFSVRHHWSHLNQCLFIINLMNRNIRQWNVNKNINICIQENVYENFVCKLSAILSRRGSSHINFHLWPSFNQLCDEAMMRCSNYSWGINKLYFPVPYSLY